MKCCLQDMTWLSQPSARNCCAYLHRTKAANTPAERGEVKSYGRWITAGGGDSFFVEVVTCRFAMLQ